MYIFISIVASTLISGVFLFCLLEFGLKNGRLNWRYAWLVLGVVLPWFYFLTDSIHISLPGGTSLDLHFRDTFEKQLQKSSFLHTPVNSAFAQDSIPRTHAVVSGKLKN